MFMLVSGCFESAGIFITWLWKATIRCDMIKIQKMKRLLEILFLFLSVSCFGQNGITFTVEKLSKPEDLLYLRSYEDIYKNMILEEGNLDRWDIEEQGGDFKYNILAMSKAPDSLVNSSFFYGMYAAYAEHRPFVLSPDMIWLLISQGFARHVNANPEEMREYFVKHSGKLSLLVLSERDLIGDSIDWEGLFPQFTAQIAEHTGQELMNTLISDFSTTTAVEKVASEITVMEAMGPYFEFVVIYIVCGIPEITLLGTPEDWEKVLVKTKMLGQYNLKWWTTELEPILEEFVRASKGNVNKRFWRNMFKTHSQKKYGAPDIIDGWIVKFFPYDKKGKRNNLTQLEGGRSLPDEFVKVDLKYIRTDGNRTEEIPLELWAGFIGLEQNPETYALRPVISWMVRKKDVDQEALLKKMESADTTFSGNFFKGIDLRISEVPEILKKLELIHSLRLTFIDEVVIPEWLMDIRIDQLTINGKITGKEIDKIVREFPSTELMINGKEYSKAKK
jgi:hypothetical protein